MSVSSPSQSERSQSGSYVTLIRVLLLVVGLFAILYLVVDIAGNERLANAVASDAFDTGDIILGFLNDYGIVFPLIVIGVGVYLILLAIRIGTYQYTPAATAKQAFFWLMVAGITYPVVFLVSNGVPSAVDVIMLHVVTPLALAVVFFLPWNWLGKNLDHLFEGGDTLTIRDTRLAWTLLIPTVAVLIFVAARPLERTFIASLTDQRFAGGETTPVNFVGLDNYGRLLGLRIDNVPCLADESGGCQTREVAVQSTDVLEVELNNDALRDILARLSAGERVTGVANLLNAIGQPEAIQNALDDPEVDIATFMQTLDGERPLGTNMLQSMINASLPDVQVSGLLSVNEGFAEVVINITETVNEVIYPNPRDITGEDYRRLGFSPVFNFDIGSNHYVFSARDAAFMRSIGNTLIFSIISVTLELILGMLIALTVNSKFKGRGLMRAAMLVPWAIPTVVSARLWEVMLRDNRSGVINSVMMNTGLIEQPMAWLADPNLQIWSLIFVDVWKTTPFFALLLLAGLQTIPSDIYEAADVDGANKVTQFFRLTLPLLRPTIAVALVFRTLDAVRAFDVFDVLIGKQLQSMATYNSFVLVEQQQFGYASTVGVTIFVIIFAFTVIYVRALGVEAE